MIKSAGGAIKRKRRGGRLQMAYIGGGCLVIGSMVWGGGL